MPGYCDALPVGCCRQASDCGDGLCVAPDAGDGGLSDSAWRCVAKEASDCFADEECGDHAVCSIYPLHYRADPETQRCEAAVPDNRMSGRCQETTGWSCAVDADCGRGSECAAENDAVPEWRVCRPRAEPPG